MKDDFKNIERNIDDAGNGCLMFVLGAIILIVYNIVF